MLPSPSPAAARWTRIPEIFTILACLGALAVNFFCLWTTWSPVPYWDHWETVADYQHFLAHGLDWRRAVAQHNEHRIVLSHLMSLADYHWFKGIGLFLIAMNVVLSCATTAVSYHLAARRLGIKPFIAGLCCLAAGTSVAQLGNLGWSFQTAWYLVLFFSLLSFAAYPRALAATTRQARCAWLIATWAMAAIATFSNANGAMTWLALLFLGLLCRASWRAQAATLAAALVFVGLYFSDFHHPAQHPPLMAALRTPSQLLFFFSFYATNALQGLGRWFQLGIGTALVASCLFMLARSSLRAGQGLRAAPETASGLAIVLYLLATIGVTALGRVALGDATYANASRYVTYGLMFLLVATFLALSSISSPSIRPLVSTAVLGVLILGFTWSGASGAPYTEARSNKQAGLLLMQCEAAQACPDEVIQKVYPNVALTRQRLVFLKEHHLAMFAPGITRIIPPLSVLDPSLLPRCVGFVDTAERLPDGMLQFRGWLVSPPPQIHLPEYISVLSSSGQNLGGGALSEERADVQRHLHLRPSRAHRMFGFRVWSRKAANPLYLVAQFSAGVGPCTLSLSKTL